jgi:hypothetical protein
VKEKQIPAVTRPKAAQTRRVLDILLAADGGWISKAMLVRHYGFTQAGARIFELENEHHWNIEHSKETDSHGFKSYRIVQRWRHSHFYDQLLRRARSAEHTHRSCLPLLENTHARHVLPPPLRAV